MELEICWLPAYLRERFCFAETVNHNILITSPLPITSNVPLNLATLLPISVCDMNGRGVICWRRNTKIERGKGKKTQCSSYFYNPWWRQVETEVLPFPTTLIFSSPFIYLFSRPFKILIWKEDTPNLASSDHKVSAGTSHVWCYHALSTSLCPSRNLNTYSTTHVNRHSSILNLWLCWNVWISMF